jgi:hypothetical protein
LLWVEECVTEFNLLNSVVDVMWRIYYEVVLGAVAIYGFVLIIVIVLSL